MNNSRIYSDKLISIVADEIIFNNYYFPTFSQKRVRLSDIEYIKIVKPSLLNGKFRIWGTGDFSHWFPLDFKRRSRDKIFILKKKYKRIKIGFSVADSEKFLKAISSRVRINLLVENEKS